VYGKEDFEHFAAVGHKEYSNFKARHPDWPLKNIEYLTRDTKHDTSNNGLRAGMYPLVRRGSH
jgi:hypothetical protein